MLINQSCTAFINLFNQITLPTIPLYSSGSKKREMGSSSEQGKKLLRYCFYANTIDIWFDLISEMHLVTTFARHSLLHGSIPGRFESFFSSGLLLDLLFAILLPLLPLAHTISFSHTKLIGPFSHIFYVFAAITKKKEHENSRENGRRNNWKNCPALNWFHWILCVRQF